MKKLILFSSLLIGSGMLFGQSQRLVMIEEFTQASCAPCAAANPAFNTLLSANTSKAVSVKYQVSWPGADPMNAQNPTEVATRVSYYGVSGVPDAFQEGVDKANPGNVTQSGIDAAYAVPSPFTIQLTHWFNSANDSIYINCDLTASQNTSLTTGVLHVGMIEKTITFTTAPGSNGETVFYNVFRKAYPNANGTALTSSWTNGQKKTVSFKAKIPSYIYSKPEIAVVAWVQDNADKSIKQAGFSPTAGTPSTLAPVADFNSDVVSSCDGLINFSDQSALFPTSWLWDFGDNTSSTQQNPVHQYTASGTYTVKMTATNANGNNQAVKSSFVTVNLSGAAPSGVNDNICGSGTANLSASASGSGTLYWYNASGSLVNTGTTYSPNCTGTTNFFVTEATPNSVLSTGAASNSIGAGAYFTASTVHGLYFDVAKPCTLVSVSMYANTAGNRTIEVVDLNGNVVQSAVKNLPAGQSTVTLNFNLPAGTGFLIRVPTIPADLYRNSAGATFPYSTSVVTITGNTASGNPGYYYYFYDWKVQQNPCMSPSAMVSAIDSCASTGISEFSAVQDFEVYPNPSFGEIHVKINAASGSYMLSVMNSLGMEVYREPLLLRGGSFSKNFMNGELKSGVYLIQIKGEGGLLSRKVVVQ